MEYRACHRKLLEEAFIERNWNLGKLSTLSRDNLSNPVTTADNPYVPTNSPAIGDLFANFSFGK